MKMPTSEDELDDRIHSSMPHSHRYHYRTGLSKAEQRKNNKPIMEKRRRARINHCLNELKTLILDATNKDPSRHTKLEKADILEMTVKHLQSIQRQQFSIAVASDPTVLHKFKTGFNECATEVSQYIGHLDGIESGVKQRLINHLTDYITGLHTTSFSPFQNSNIPNQNSNYQNQNLQSTGGNDGDCDRKIEDVNNNNSRFQNTQGLHLIPSRLPTGELALLLPNSSHLNSIFSSINNNSITDRSHPSAFTAVAKDLKKSSSPTPDGSTAPRYLLSPHPEVSSTSNDISVPPVFKIPETIPKPPITIFESNIPISVPKPGSDIEFKNFNFQNDPNFLRPVTVYTDDDSLITSKSNHDKKPLDFSMRKDGIDSSKKRPLEDISCNIQSAQKKIKHSFIPTKNGEEIKDFLDKPSSSSSSAMTSKSETTRDSMWRPW